MYYQHFGLSGPPFEFDPSSPVLFMSAGHREALAALEWGMLEPSGFTMLVGEIGTGKTTLICSLLAASHRGVRTAWVANPRLSFEEILVQLLGQLGVNISVAAGKLALLEAFDARLASLDPDECAAIIFDEAQDLSDDALEDLRLLSNSQSRERRRLQIVLVGQIDLARRLAGPQMRQLNQRIGARALLPTLARGEVRDYADYRLRASGGDLNRLFTYGAVRELVRASGGIPRRINVLCHNALLMAYAQEKDRVGDQNMRDAARDYDHLPSGNISVPAKIAAAAGATMHSAAGIGGGFSAIIRRIAAAAFIRPATGSAAATIGRKATAVGTYTALFLLGIVLVGFSQVGPVRTGFSVLTARLEPQPTHPRPAIPTEHLPAQFKGGSDQIAPSGPNRMEPAPFLAPDEMNTSANKSLASDSTEGFSINLPEVAQDRVADHGATTKTEPASKADPASKIASIAKVPTFPEVPAPEDPSATPPGATVVVKAGDTLSKIAKRIYGSFGTDELSRLIAANPQITNANLIFPGQSLSVQYASKSTAQGYHQQ